MIPFINPPSSVRTSATANVVDFGAVGDGVTDDTAAWRSAMISAGGGEVFVPRGRYLLKDCEIPVGSGCDIVPEGGVEVLVPRGANYGGLYFRGELNYSSATTATDVAVVTDYQTQSVTKITGDFTGYAKDDICILYCDATQTVGLCDAEAFQVLDVAGDGSYIYANRLFINSHNAATSTVKVRRATARPRIRIRKGMTMRPNGDATAAGAKSSMVRLLCPIDADIEVDFDGLWNIGLWMTSSWRGRYEVTWNNVQVDYSIDAYGYICSVQGACYAPEFVLRGTKGGHAIAVSARTGAFSEANWFYFGIPFAHYVHDSIVTNSRRATYDEHYGYHGVFANCVSIHAKLDAVEASNQQDAFALNGLNTLVINCVGDGVKTFISYGSKNYGREDTLTVISPVMRSRGAVGVSGLILAKNHITDLASIRISGGVVDVDAVGIFDNYKIRAVVTGTTFQNCSRLFSLAAAGSSLSLIGCIYSPNASSASYAGTVGLSTQTLTVEGLHVTAANEITHVAQIVQGGATVYMGRVTCPTSLSRFTGQAPTVVDIVTATS